MQARILNENLNKAAKAVKPAIAKRSTLPILTHALAETVNGGLRLTATDLDLWLSVDVGAQVEAEGSAMVDVAALAAAKLPKRGIATINGAVEAGGLTIPAAFPPADYPTIWRETTGEPVATYWAPELLRALESVIDCVARDDSRPALTGVYFHENGEIAAADGFRLGIYDTGQPIPEAFNLPGHAAKLLIRQLRKLREPIALYRAEHLPKGAPLRSVIFRSRYPGWELGAWPIAGVFPNYQSLVPVEWQTRVTVDRAAMKAAVDGAMPVARDGSGIVRLVATMATGEGLEVSARADGMNYSVTVPAQVERAAEAVEHACIAFNSRYLADTIASGAGPLVLEISNPYSQGLWLSPDVPGHKIVCMPMYVDWGEATADSEAA